jgi:hypothetical protein
LATQNDGSKKLLKNQLSSLEKEVMTRRKKTSCFGGFYLSLRVKLASKVVKIPEI